MSSGRETPEEIREKYKELEDRIETENERRKRLNAKRAAKSRHFKKLEQSSATGSSTRTRSQTEPVAARTRKKESARLRKQRQRASISEAQKEEIRKKDRERY